MNKLFGIIGAILFVIAVVIGNFCSFAASTVVELALGAFGLAAVVISTIKSAKENKIALWKCILVVVLAIAGGVLLCIGGASSSIFAELSGAVLAVLAIILGILSKSAEN